jgi:hypothetical protein
VNRDPAEYHDGMNLYSGYFSQNGLDPNGLYDEAGHFYTTYIIAQLAGFNDLPGYDKAFDLAYWSQYPDEDYRYDAISALHTIGIDAQRIQFYLHSLSGGDSKCTRKSLEDLLRGGGLERWEMGMVIHAFGDSFAHSKFLDGKEVQYVYPFGHAEDGHEPDHIINDREKYKNYARRLFMSLGGTDLSKLNELFKRVDNFTNPEMEIGAMRLYAKKVGFNS